MTAAVQLENGFGRKELQQICRRFTNLHRERLRRIGKELRPSQRDFIELLPLLFHINHPMLPGFVNSETPAGIADFSPSKAVLKLARGISRSFEFKKRAYRRFPVQGIYLMGSMGSIAHTNRSDFDIWLCHDPGLEPPKLQALCAKAEKLEAWAKELEIEVHFFVMNAHAFRRGERAALSQESSGTAQQRLLLDEFYRTGILLAGRRPLWWLVPPEQEGNYKNYTEMLIKKRFLDPRDYLDFGGLEKLPAEEYFGAARWHLYKGIESPYKSVLKILLMEAYSREYPTVRWLCQEAKAAIYQGKHNLRQLDPYILLYNRVDNYLQERREPERLELARRCFYFKTEQTLSQEPASGKENWRREMLAALVQQWGWSNTDLLALDSRHSWKVDRVMEERNILVRELSYSYRLLTDFAREHAENHSIDPIELSLLGRKLYASLEQRPGKIGRINPGISHDLTEERLSLHLSGTQDGSQRWDLFRGDVGEQNAEKARPLKTTSGLVEMLTWCHLNQIVDKGTVVGLYPEECSLSLSELHAMLHVLRDLYPPGESDKVPLTALSKPPAALSCALFINIGQDPMAHLTRVGKQLTSNRSNPLSFGATHSSLVSGLEQLIWTSWGELLVFRYQGTEGLLDSLCHFMRLVLQGGHRRKTPKVSAHGFSSIRAAGIAKRVEHLYKDLYRNFGPQGEGKESRYLVQISDQLYLLQHDEEDFSWLEVESQEDLYDLLGQPQSRFRPLVIDTQTLCDTALPTLFKHNKGGVIQLFYEVFKDRIELYILDEQGALFHQSTQGVDEQYLLMQHQRFFDDLYRRHDLLTGSPAQALPGATEYYRLNRAEKGNWSVAPRLLQHTRVPADFIELRLISSSADPTQGPISLICDMQEFSSLALGDQLYTRVAEYILSRRRGKRDYPIYLTGADLSAPAGGQTGSTIEMLNLKKRLERRLNQALRELSSGG